MNLKSPRSTPRRHTTPAVDLEAGEEFVADVEALTGFDIAENSRRGWQLALIRISQLTEQIGALVRRDHDSADQNA